MAGELAFFELGVGDTERGRAFYEELFGWRFETGPSGGGFMIAAPNVPGGMHGGDPGAAPLLFFQVAGEVEEMDVEGDEASIERFGRFKLCRDDQGSSFGLHEPPAGSRSP